MKKMRKIVDNILRLKFILSPFGWSTPKKALAFEKGVGKTVVFPCRKAKRSKTECWKPWVSEEQIPFATGRVDCFAI
jgi:hypothetical protein